VHELGHDESSSPSDETLMDPCLKNPLHQSASSRPSMLIAGSCVANLSEEKDLCEF